MLSRLSRTLLRAFPAILLVIVGLVAALFRRRRGTRIGITVPASVSSRPPVSPARRGGAAIAALILLLGIGVIVAARDDDSVLWRLMPQRPTTDGDGGRPRAAQSRTDVGAVRGSRSPAAAPDGPGVATASGASGLDAPTFDTVRVEPNGDFVVAGRAMPNGTVELLVDGKSVARTVADANGQFAIVPPALSAGNSEVGLRVTDGQGSVRRSRDSVAVAVSGTRDAKPLVALTSPDRPTVVLSQPGPAADAAPPRQSMAASGPPIVVAPGTDASGRGGSNPVSENGEARSRTTKPSDVSPANKAFVEGSGGASTKIVSVDARDGGRLFVTGRAAADAAVRLYLNDTLIAPARVGRDGTVTFAIGGGVKSGAYKVRLDQVDAASGQVKSRVEVPFSVPEVARIAGTDRSVTPPHGAVAAPNGFGLVTSNARQPVASPPLGVPRPGEDAGAPDGRKREPSSDLPVAASPETTRDPPEAEAGSAVVLIPEVRTARIERGDSLWAISRRTYGDGDRYTAIYDANQDQIRDPELIYPGQVFVLPSEDSVEAEQDDKRN